MDHRYWKEWIKSLRKQRTNTRTERMKKHFGVMKSKKFTKNTLRICCGYAIIIRDVSFCI